MRALAVTGYKPMEMNIFKPNDKKIHFIKAAISKRIQSFVEEGLEWVLVSGQMGVELWTCEVVLDLKRDYDINLGIIPPFENQTKRWPEHYQSLYEEMSIQADFHQSLYKDDYKGPFQFKARDKWLINKSDGCLVLLDEEFPGSTHFFLDEAKLEFERNSYPIYTITPYDLEETVQEILDQNPEYWIKD